MDERHRDMEVSMPDQQHTRTASGGEVDFHERVFDRISNLSERVNALSDQVHKELNGTSQSFNAEINSLRNSLGGDLGEIKDVVNKIASEQVFMASRLAEVTSKVEKLHSAVFVGNGTPPIQARIQSVEAAQRVIGATVSELTARLDEKLKEFNAVGSAPHVQLRSDFDHLRSEYNGTLRTAKWLVGIVLTGVFSVLATALTLLFEYFRSK
jgi:ElaB/YqjD/DUF883 family membrane-anchored ribosome-binding protein